MGDYILQDESSPYLGPLYIEKGISSRCVPPKACDILSCLATFYFEKESATALSMFYFFADIKEICPITNKGRWRWNSDQLPIFSVNTMYLNLNY